MKNSLFLTLIFLIFCDYYIFANEEKKLPCGFSTLNSLQIIDSILNSPNIIEELIKDTNLVIINKNSWLTQKEYVNNLINFLKENEFINYEIQDVSATIVNESIDKFQGKLYVDIVQKVNRKKIIFIFIMNNQELKWKITSIDIFEPKKLIR